jgi:hypothetical protein
LAALVAIGTADAAFAQASKGLDPGSKVDLILEPGRFLSPLPFDVQFYLRGVAPEDLVEAKGRFAHLTRALRLCSEVLPRTSQAAPSRPAPPRTEGGQPAVPTPTDPMVPPPPPPRRPPRIYQIDTVRPFMDGSTRVFELSVDPLAPNKDYCFEFTMRYRIKEEEIQSLAVEGIDTALRAAYTRPDRETATQAGYETLRQEVIAAIEAIARRKEAEKGIDIEIDWGSMTGTIFQRPRPGETAAEAIAMIPPAFHRQFSDAIQAQSIKRSSARTFGTASGDAAIAADALFNDKTFQRMLQQVNAHAGDPSLSVRLTGLEGALNLATADRRPAAEGLTREEARLAVPPDQVWDPNALAGRIANLEQSIARFVQLRDLAQDLATSPGLRRAAVLEPKTPEGAANPNAISGKELEAVALVADDARDAFQQARNLLGSLERSLGERTQAISTMAAHFRALSEQVTPFRGSTTSNWETRAGQHISVDVGLAWSEPIDSTFFYVGTNIYTGPVNKKAPLSWSDQSFRKRFAFLFAIPLNPFEQDQTVNQFANAPQTLEGVIGKRPLLTGAGWRLTDFIRLTGGTVLFKVKSANPLLDIKPTTHVTWFVSMSVDWDLKGMFFSGVATGNTPPAPQSSVR